MALTVTINLSEADEKCLRHDLLDVDDWIRQAVAGKLNACRKRLVAEAHAVFRDDRSVDAIPTDDDALISMFVSRPDYMDRINRDRVAKP